MKERHYNIIGLVGFIISGVFFTISALKSGDILVLAGSLVWIAACIVWLIPLVRKRD